MTSEYVILNNDEEEDVILEGSDLHKALTSMGYDNFESVPRVEVNYEQKEIGTLKTDYQYIRHLVNDKMTAVGKLILGDDQCSQSFLEAILNAKVLLDDHAVVINGFLSDHQTSKSRTLLKWLPILGSTMTVMFYPFLGKNRVLPLITATSVLGLSAFRECENWFALRKCRYFVALQNELYHLCKRSLKVLSRTFDRKSISYEVSEQQKLIGPEKYKIICSMKEVMVEFFYNVSKIYHDNAKIILSVLPSFVQASCHLTDIEEDKHPDAVGLDCAYLRNLYYTYILIQSETIFIMASAYNGRSENRVFPIPKKEVFDAINIFLKSLKYYHSKLSGIFYEYQMCKSEPMRRMFGGFADSRWRDTCLHLDLTSQKIQLAYQEITSIIEYIESSGEKVEDDQQIVDSIAQKMDQVYKQIENAKSFAEFSRLLITKLENGYLKKTEDYEKGGDILPPVSGINKIVIDLNEEPEIEDEVFEEYIREEYLKPIMKISDSNDQDVKFDELLVKNFMSELKEVLIEKQKIMNEREMKALKRMYNQMKKDHSSHNLRIETEGSCNPGRNNSPERIDPPPPSPSPAPPMPPLPPPPPPPPPRNMPDSNQIEVSANNEKVKQAKSRTPVPLPRVKMWNPENEIADVQRFSISDCVSDFNRIPPPQIVNEIFLPQEENLKSERVMRCPPSFPFPSFKLAEETFLGSGENSEEEMLGSDDEMEDLEAKD